MSANSGVFVLQCGIQKYAWGKIGMDSAVASLFASSRDTEEPIDPVSPYAELWMGTHPKAPAYLHEGKSSLCDWLKANPSAIGSEISERFKSTDQLPFLLKVLSVNKALSIQAHPNKFHAEKLHKTNPDKYPDDNHKPELAIALTPFEGLCGFRAKSEILDFMKTVPELSCIVGKTVQEELRAADGEDAIKHILKRVLNNLMTQECGQVERQLNSLVKRLENEKQSTGTESELVLRLNSQFPGDVGCFCVYLLNHMHLQPGQAMFLAANIPHAYLSGDCIECMACSDNVVRAGLTPKFKDVQTLVEMLDYRCRSAEENMFPGVTTDDDPYLTRYNPPVPDFCVDRIVLPSGVTSYTMAGLDSASIVLVFEGQLDFLSTDGSSETSLSVHKGHVLFVAANHSLSMRIVSQSALLFRAHCMA